MNRDAALLLWIVMMVAISLVVGFAYASYRDNRFRIVPGYSWAIDGRTGQLCDPWPANYETAIKDSEGIPYCVRLR